MQTNNYRVVVFKQKGRDRFGFNLTDQQTGNVQWGPSAGFMLRETAQVTAERAIEEGF